MHTYAKFDDGDSVKKSMGSLISKDSWLEVGTFRLSLYISRIGVNIKDGAVFADEISGEAVLYPELNNHQSPVSYSFRYKTHYLNHYELEEITDNLVEELGGGFETKPIMDSLWDALRKFN